MKKILLSLIAFFVAMTVCSTANMALCASKYTPEEKAVIYYTTASAYSELKDHKSAIKYYTKAIKSNPKMTAAYIGKAKECGDIGDYKCALKNCEILKKMCPDDPTFYWATSIYKENTGDLDGAMADIDKAISMTENPQAKYYTQKAWIYFDKGESANTCQYLQKAYDTNPNDNYTMGLFVHIVSIVDDYETVVEASRKLLKLEVNKNNHVLYALYAKALYKTGNKEEAIKEINTAIQIEPSNQDYPILKDKMQKGEEI